MANGRAASVEAHDSLAREAYLAIAEVTGQASSARILLAAPLSLADIDAEFADAIEEADELSFDKAAASLRARRVKRLGALVISEQVRPVPATDEAASALARGIAGLGVARSAANRFRAAVARPDPVPASRGYLVARPIR